MGLEDDEPASETDGDAIIEEASQADVEAALEALEDDEQFLIGS